MKIGIRPVLPADMDQHFADQADPASAAMAGIGRRDRAAFDAHWAEWLAAKDKTVRSITADGQVVGNLLHWQREGRHEVGYRISQAWWGHGIASAALPLFVAELAVRPLHAQVTASNAGSIRVLERAGFVRAGGCLLPDPDGVELSGWAYRLD